MNSSNEKKIAVLIGKCFVIAGYSLFREILSNRLQESDLPEELEIQVTENMQWIKTFVEEKF